MGDFFLEKGIDITAFRFREQVSEGVARHWLVKIECFEFVLYKFKLLKFEIVVVSMSI